MLSMAPPRPVRPSAGKDRPADHPLTVLLVHNRYQLPGGEDGVFEREGALLEAHGHRVLRYELHNDEVDGLGRAALLGRTLWSRPAYAQVRQTVETAGVDIVHVHNTLPLASPAVFHAAHAGGAATVHTLHNYRLVCPGTLLLRDGVPCHDCVGLAFAAPGVRHACYRDSRAATAAVATAVAVHRALGTWDRAVDRYIALSAFARGVFVEGGLPAERVVVKPNLLPADPAPGAGGGDVLFAGRLAEGKGLEVVLEAWAADPGLPPLRVAGDGPLAPLVEEAARHDGRITWLGWVGGAALGREMAAAAALVAPSTCYDGPPLVVIEAMGAGTPVVLTDHGPSPELVADGETGRLVPRGDAAALAAAVRALAEAPSAPLRRRVRQFYAGHLAREVSYRRLRTIYDDALAQYAATR